MGNDIFREKNLEKINSPENLDEYIRVTNPGIWLLLVGIIVLLIGAIVWGYAGSIETWEETNVFVNGGQAYCLVRPEASQKIESGMSIVVGEVTGVLLDNIENREDGAIYSLDIEIPNGTYSGRILIEKIRPKVLIFN